MSRSRASMGCCPKPRSGLPDAQIWSGVADKAKSGGLPRTTFASRWHGGGAWGIIAGREWAASRGGACAVSPSGSGSTSPRGAAARMEFYNRLMPWLPNARATEPSPMRLAPPDSVTPGPWDPAFFHDPDTDRWFLYWGSSNVYPLYGIELDKSKQLDYVGKPVP